VSTLSEQYKRDGFVFVEGALESGAVASLAQSYEDYLDTLAYAYLAGSDARVDYDDLPLPHRFATLLGVSGGRALHHLDPVLNSFLPHYKYQADLPSAQIPALFELMSHPKLIDVIETLIGPEVTASPIYHLNFKLARQHLDLVQTIAQSVGSQSKFKSDGATNDPDKDPALERFFGFQVGKTDWHMDAISGLYDSHESEIANAWIPINPCTEANGCLLVIPGSHTNGVRGGPFPEEERAKAVALPANPGDVVVLHNKVLHSATENTTKDGFRWAFNFRYLPTGEPSGRPFLPGFVARSRSNPSAELKNPYLWSMMWHRALDYLTQNGSPFSYTDLREGALDLEFARNLTADWNARISNHHSGLNINA